MTRLYFDHAASTPVLPEAVEAMHPWVLHTGNASSIHHEGRAARAAMDQAREGVSKALHCEFSELIFTSGGTEAAQLAILGAALANEDRRRNRVLFSSVEHHCVLQTQDILERLGYQVEHIPVDREGIAQIPKIGDDILLVSLQSANNELGTIQPVAEVGTLCRERGVLFHCDAVQSFLSFDVDADLISVSAHKVGGPKGVGALFVRAGTKLKPVQSGGGQERELRAGTENVAGIVGFGAAVATPRPDTRAAARKAFANALSSRFTATVKDARTLAGHHHVLLTGVSAESMLILLDRMGVAASSGAACSAGSLEPSHVLIACGYSKEQAGQGLRFSFGRITTEEEALAGANIVNQAAQQIEDLKA